MIDRRAFVAAGAAALVTLPLGAIAQTSGATPRVGFLTPGPNPREVPFWQGMRDLGYVDGKSIVVDRRSAEGDLSRLPDLAAQLVKTRPSVIVVVASAAAIAAKGATRTIPIVVIGSNDPVAAGLVGNLARPGGNVTGTSTQTSAATSKLVELVPQFLPKTRRVAALWDPINAVSQQLRLGEILIAAARLHVLVKIVEVESRGDLDRIFDALGRERPDAVLVSADTFFVGNAGRVAELALANRLPVFATQRVLTEAGSLASYGPDLPALSRRTATYVQRILNGAKPGDLAIELPTKFELVINMKTAKALDITVPPALLSRADEVIR